MRGRSAGEELRAAGVEAVAMTWVDTSGITRVKAVPVARLEYAAEWGIGASPVFDAFLVDDSIISGRHAGGPAGDLRLFPDLDRLRMLASPAGWAWAPADRYAQDGAAHAQDARQLLRAATGRLAGQGLSVLAAFEVEWVVSDGTGDDFAPACQGPAYGMARLTELSGYLLDVLEAMDGSGVEVVQIHPEYAAGQYELSVACADPVAAADTTVLVKEIIRSVSLEHDLRPSFAPKVDAGAVGNGRHVHLSLWRDGVNTMAGGDRRYGMTGDGESFAAGILERLPALLAVGCPAAASYLRLIPSHWAGAFQCWGLENREAALRFVTGPPAQSGEAANLEIKCFDPAADPYLALAALLAAGEAGLAAGARLPEPVDIDPGGLPAAERSALGIAPLPASLDEAVKAFEADPVLRAALGEQIADTVADVRRGESALFAGVPAEEIAARTRWRH